MIPLGRAVSQAEKNEILNALSLAWRAHPDWRLGQLLDNAEIKRTSDVEEQSPLFYREDNLILAGLKKLLVKGL